MQKDVIENKKEKDFNISNVEQGFCLLYGEVAEDYDAYSKKKNDLGLELADMVRYSLSISELLGCPFQDEIIKIMETKTL